MSAYSQHRRQQGFTLMEVMVAIAVLALALGAIIQAVGNNTANASYLRDRTLAHWVAMNKVAEWQSLQVPPPDGGGSEEMANHDWYWTAKVVDAGIEGVKRVEVTVKRDRNDKQALATLIALLGKSGN